MLNQGAAVRQHTCVRRALTSALMDWVSDWNLVMAALSASILPAACTLQCSSALHIQHQQLVMLLSPIDLGMQPGISAGCCAIFTSYGVCCPLTQPVCCQKPFVV